MRQRFIGEVVVQQVELRQIFERLQMGQTVIGQVRAAAEVEHSQIPSQRFQLRQTIGCDLRIKQRQMRDLIEFGDLVHTFIRDAGAPDRHTLQIRQFLKDVQLAVGEFYVRHVYAGDTALIVEDNAATEIVVAQIFLQHFHRRALDLFIVDCRSLFTVSRRLLGFGSNLISRRADEQLATGQRKHGQGEGDDTKAKIRRKRSHGHGNHSSSKVENVVGVIRSG